VPGLVEGGADRAVVDGSEQVALFDQLTLLDQKLGEDAVDLWAHHHAVQREHRADAAGVAGDVFFADGDDPDRDRSRGGKFGRCGFYRIPQAGGCEGDQQGGEQGLFLLDLHACGAPGGRGLGRLVLYKLVWGSGG